jgi:hypothetical protein
MINVNKNDKILNIENNISDIITSTFFNPSIEITYKKYENEFLEKGYEMYELENICNEIYRIELLKSFYIVDTDENIEDSSETSIDKKLHMVNEHIYLLYDYLLTVTDENFNTIFKECLQLISEQIFFTNDNTLNKQSVLILFSYDFFDLFYIIILDIIKYKTSPVGKLNELKERIIKTLSKNK